MELSTIILAASAAGTFGIYYFVCWNLNYFERKRIPYIESAPLLGNLGPVVFRRMSFAKLIQKIYNFHPEAKYVGFNDPSHCIMIRDPELIKSIAIKNFGSFPNHIGFVDEVQDPVFGKTLVLLPGEKWRNMRTLLGPAFTTSKLKTMFKMISKCATDFTDHLTELSTETIVLEVKDVFTRYTNDVIATSAFGITVNSMRDRDNDFFLMGKDATNFNGLRSMKFFLLKHFPTLTKLLNVKLVSDKVASFFTEVIRATITKRDEENIVRPDMIELMMRTRDETGQKLSINDIAAQAFGIYFGGFDTSATLLCFAAHEIAANPDVQRKLRAEVDAVLEQCDDELTYEALHGMQYLDGVLNETSRMYPLVPALDRVCVKSFEMPPAMPGFKSFTIEPGTIVWFPAYGIHHDPRYFPEPDKFDPERFTNVNKAMMMPFGIGPRACIGKRFGLMETKLVLIRLLARFNLKPCTKTSIPMRLSRKSFTLTARDGFWMQLERRI